ncbi:MAG: glycosyltransferase family 39 protein [Deltaproteobacteria bacterium]|nr:glycosyltransferase family 39 protein [Deltaproteobacteria bacterium]
MSSSAVRGFRKNAKFTSMALKIADKPGTWVLAFLFFLYAIRLFFIAYLQLAPDEAYYWYWSKHLDWSYFDHPPMTAYIMAVFTALGGDTQFFVRLGGLLCSVLSLFFIYHSWRKLFPGDGRFSWEFLAIMNVTLLFSAGCIIQTPDTPLLLFWTAAFYCGIQIITGGGAFWWYIWGIALGMGLLSKYTMILAVPCQFAFFLVSRPNRYWLLRKEPYIALLLGATIFSPVILWNWQHEWVSFAFQSHQGFSGDIEFMGSRLLEYIGGQAGVITPGIFLAFVFYSLKGLYMSVTEGIPEYLYLAFFSWPVLAFFTFSTMIGGVAEPNWPAPGYIAGLMLMWAVYRQLFGKRKDARKALMHAAVGLAVIISAVVHVHLIRPIIPLAPNDDVAKQFHGWRDLGEAIETFIAKYPHESGYFLIAERGPSLAEAIFYSRKQYTGVDWTRPERYIFLGDTSQLKEKNALILLRQVDESILERYQPYFRHVTVIGSHQPRYRQKIIKEFSFHIILGQGYRGGWRHFDGGKKLEV